MIKPRIPSKSDLDSAWERVRPHIHRTPLITSRLLDQILGRPLFLKAENLQRTGSFKIRGALNMILSLSDKKVRQGVVTYSSGNHAQAVALAASIRGIPATVVMPKDVPRVKREATEGYGAKVILGGETASDRLLLAEKFAKENGSVMVPPYEGDLVICGQSTVGREILEDRPTIKTIYAPIGGGGLISGIALSARYYGSDIRVIGVEPELAASMTNSLKAGRVVRTLPGPTIADGLKPDTPGEINLAIIQKYVENVVLVNERDIKEALELIITRTKMLVEPSAAVALAGAKRMGCEKDGETACILSGGNVSPTDLKALLE